MQVVNKKMCVIVILVLVIIESCTLFLMYKSYSNKNTSLDEVNLNISNSNMFAIMLEQDDGTYKEDTTNTWPTSGYTYNESMSGCIDINGNRIDNALTYDSTNNIATVDTGNTSYCYLYFSLPATAFAVYSADDTSLTFYKNKDSVTAGQQYKGKTATAVYTGIEEEGYSRKWNSISSIITSVVIADEISPKSTYSWFYRFNNSSLTMDLAKLDTSKVTNMGSMFRESSIITLDIGSWDTSNVTDMNFMFANTSITSLDIGSWNVSNVTRMSYMFADTSITSLDIGSWDTSNVTDMDFMFADASITSLDIGSWDVSNVTNMNSMFSNCSKLTNLKINLSLDLSRVNFVVGMFSGCSSLTIDLSNWNLNNTVTGTPMNYCSFNFGAPGVTPPSGLDVTYSSAVCGSSGGSSGGS